jgi:DNA polymerase III subunit delta
LNVSAQKTVYWNQATSAALVLITGTESYLASRATRKIKDELRSTYPELEILEVGEGEYSPSLLFSIAAPSLFAEPRLILISGSGDGLLEDLEKYVAEPIENCFVVLRLPNSVGQNGKIKSQLAKSALTVSCEEIKKDAERAEFIKQEFASMNQKVDPAAIKALQGAFNQDLGELGAACNQLASAGATVVTLQQVEDTFQGRLETNAFKIADAALGGNASEAIRLFRHGFSTGIDPVPLTAALAMRIRQLARMYNDRNASPAALGMAPWQLDKARRELQGWQEAELISLVDLLAQTDADVKGASRDPEFSIEKLLLAMARAS